MRLGLNPSHQLPREATANSPTTTTTTTHPQATKRSSTRTKTDSPLTHNTLPQEATANSPTTATTHPPATNISSTTTQRTLEHLAETITPRKLKREKQFGIETGGEGHNKRSG
mmetsp:Transcript_42623/g.79005  ORF Transcript_42623/g.79005 Transcript_42623/m.79005 type:complete len:113 (-) Transcript_42623:37-375(-)